MDWNGMMMGEAKKWQLLLMIGRLIIVRVRGFGGWMEAALPQMGFEFERYQLKLKHKSKWKTQTAKFLISRGSHRTQSP